MTRHADVRRAKTRVSVTGLVCYRPGERSRHSLIAPEQVYPTGTGQPLTAHGL